MGFSNRCRGGFGLVRERLSGFVADRAGAVTYKAEINIHTEHTT